MPRNLVVIPGDAQGKTNVTPTGLLRDVDPKKGSARLIDPLAALAETQEQLWQRLGELVPEVPEDLRLAWEATALAHRFAPRAVTLGTLMELECKPRPIAHSSALCGLLEWLEARNRRRETMDLTLETIPVPLRDDGHGGLLVGRTRVSFESVWHMHQQGVSAGEIVRAFDTLQLADVHAVLAWALRHSDDLGAYLKRRYEEAVQIRRRLEAAGLTPTREQSAELKEKLMARRKDLEPRGTDDAALSDG